jgi:crossover junction endodeoxyribonuclease RusA
MNNISITLPYPPTVNHYKKVGRTITTKRGKIFQQKINSPQTNRFFYEVWLKIQTLKAQEGLKSFDDDTISVEVYIYPPDKRKRDIDNPIKPLLDSLQKAGMYNDDNQIARLLITRCNTIDQGQIIVRIATYEPQSGTAT